MRIRVTDGHIRQGIRGEPCSCPIALAIIEQYTATCSVAGSRIMVAGVRYVTPEEVLQRIYRYDATGEMEPHDFVLDTPEYGNSTGAMNAIEA